MSKRSRSAKAARRRGPTPARQRPADAPPPPAESSLRPPAAIVGATLVTAGGLLARNVESEALWLVLLLAFNVCAVLIERRAWRLQGTRQMLVTLGAGALSLVGALAGGGIGLVAVSLFAAAMVVRFGPGIGSAFGIGSAAALSLAGLDAQSLFAVVLGITWPALALGVYLDQRRPVSSKV